MLALSPFTPLPYSFSPPHSLFLFLPFSLYLHLSLTLLPLSPFSKILRSPSPAMDSVEFFNSGDHFDKNPETKTTAADLFAVDDLLDFSAEDAGAGLVTADVITDSSGAGGGGGGGVTAVESCNSTSFSGSDQHFVGDVMGRRTLFDSHFSDLCLPQYDDHVEELEWLSSFVEESFSSEDLQKLQLISGIKTRPDYEPEPEPDRNNTMNPVALLPEAPVPGKARSKRSRAAPGDWTSRLVVLSEPDPTDVPDGVLGKKSGKGSKKKEIEINVSGSGTGGGGGGGGGSDGRKCLHCATDKTPQWRTGPMGPKTLCNACGVRYKSGRLVPEYRPAASPTFMLTKHSNSHRKVMELRRQKEVSRSSSHHHHQHQQQQQMIIHDGMMYDLPNGDDYLIHQTVGHDFRQMI
ncbi:GATA transcription factor 12-like [Impatiens glandulifera]|uniref:GATA transcription factor 12-like n=1 Tax=Impatiens glandulifera TaxID=253017 RepID=UPI001FB11EAF|nr:GATA transcription factor 12-like [Impatiens glandulifera]